MSDTAQDHTPLNLQEQIARIDNLLATAAKAKVEAAWARAETERFPLWVGVEVC